jgi:hypothetical protein
MQVVEVQHRAGSAEARVAMDVERRSGALEIADLPEQARHVRHLGRKGVGNGAMDRDDAKTGEQLRRQVVEVQPLLGQGENGSDAQTVEEADVFRAGRDAARQEPALLDPGVVEQ